MTKSKKDKTDGFLTILFFLFTLYLGALGGIITVLKDISSTVEIGFDRLLVNQIYGMVLTGAGAFIFFYLVIIALVGALELKMYYNNLGAKAQKFRDSLRRYVLSTPSEFFFGILPIGGFIVITLLYYFNPAFTLVSMILYLIAGVLILTAQTKWGGGIRKTSYSLVVASKRRSCGAIWLALFAIVIILLTIFIVFSVTLFSLAKYDINLDKERYSTNDNVLVMINPHGIVKPVTQGVYYSNTHLPLDYKKDQAFGGAPVYTVIESSNLTDLPFNSYLSVQYVLPYTIFLRKNLTQEIFIPVFFAKKITSINATDNVSINNTTVKNYYFS